MKICLWLALVLAALPARAAPADMNTTTCQDWLDAGEDEQEQMIAWLRGYMAGRGTGALFDVAHVRADAASLKRFCQGHVSAGLVSAAGQFSH